MRVVVTGGGTGGHVFSSIAVAECLAQNHTDAEILFIGSQTGPEVQAAESAGLKFEGLNISGIIGRNVSDRVKALFLFLKGFARCRKVLRDFKPLCVTGTGGYAAAPACFAAITCRIPLILQEMNYKPGLVTRLLARFASAVAIAHKETSKLLPERTRTILTGVPVRRRIEMLADEESAQAFRKEGLRLFELDLYRKTLLVFGGSQGSQAINQAVWEVVPRLKARKDIQVLHLTGKDGYKDPRLKAIQKELTEAPLIYRVLRYTVQMELAYSVSDLAVSRAGAGTLAELEAARLPSVLVPYPYAAAGHQDANAEQLARMGAARVVKQDNDSAVAALEEAIRILDTDHELAQMKQSMRQQQFRSASEAVVALVEELSERR